MSALIPDRLATLLHALDRIPYAGRRDAIANEVIETGGEYHAYRVPHATARFYCELHLHGIRSTGRDEAAMIENWIEAARAHMAGLKAA